MEDEISTTLMGLVEMDPKAASRELSSMERVRLARSCRNAVSGACRKTSKIDTKDCFANVEAISQHVKIKLSNADIKIIHEDKMVNNHCIKDISSVSTLVDVESQVVYIGHCSVRNKIIAVVLSFGSLKCARALVNNLQQNQKVVQRSEQFQAKDMAGVCANTLRLSSGEEISIKKLDEDHPNTHNLPVTNTDNQTTINPLTDRIFVSHSNESRNETTGDIKGNESNNETGTTLQASMPQLQEYPKETSLSSNNSESFAENVSVSSIDKSDNNSTDKVENMAAPIPQTFEPLLILQPDSISNNSESLAENVLLSTIDKLENISKDNAENMAAPIPQTFAPLLSLQPDNLPKATDSLKKDTSLVTKEIIYLDPSHVNKDKGKKQSKLGELPPTKVATMEFKSSDSDKRDNQNNNNKLKSIDENTTKEVSATEDKICTNKPENKSKKKSFLSSLKVSRSRKKKYRHQPHIQFLISQINSTDIIGETHRNSISSGETQSNSSSTGEPIYIENHNEYIKITGKGDYISDFSDSEDEYSFHNDDHLYGLLGLKREDQERIYFDFSENESIPGDTPEEQNCNQINYLLNDEYMYLETTKLLAVGKDSFPEEIQLLLEPLESLPEFHDNLYRSLYDGLNDSSIIAKAFLDRIDSFPLYESILVNSFEVERIINILPESEKTSFVHLLEPLKIARRRLQFYFTILDSMLKLTPSRNNTLQEAADMIRGYCQRADTTILISSIRNSPINLHVFKPLLLHSCFNMTGCKLEETKMYRVLLFETLMVVTVVNKHYNDYLFDIRIELAHLKSDEGDNIFSLEIEKSVFKNEKYVFKTTENCIKKMWCKEIADIQNKYLEKVENTLT
ncbi:unnamed protein product [Meganyctiphanes norvegica]|uniref:DH domain-containing protein n=1 Tax=Meganyctiphanes norvegica TaxID=48144 RepID=A0AAV2PRR3_MEGNR